MKRFRRLPMPRGPRGAFIWSAWSAGIVATLAFGYVIGAGSFTEQQATLAEGRETYRATLTGIREERKQREALDRGLQAFIDRTLGGDVAAADSALRARLNRIGEELRLLDLRVATGTSTARQSPAKNEFGRSGREKPFHDEVDFVEVQATVSCEGTLEQVLKLVHRIDVEPWIKRMDLVRFEELKDGERIKATVRLSTLFVPNKKSKSEMKASEAEIANFERYRGIVAANPFRVPKPAAPPTAVATQPGLPPPPPPPSGFPYEQWHITGLVSGPLGIEAWLRNVATGETKQLSPGQQFGEVVFVGSDGDVAEFSFGAARFKVQVGGDLVRR